MKFAVLLLLCSCTSGVITKNTTTKVRYYCPIGYQLASDLMCHRVVSTKIDDVMKFIYANPNKIVRVKRKNYVSKVQECRDMLNSGRL